MTCLRVLPHGLPPQRSDRLTHGEFPCLTFGFVWSLFVVQDLSIAIRLLSLAVALSSTNPPPALSNGYSTKDYAG
jgi:hypothetical protein